MMQSEDNNIFIYPKKFQEHRQKYLQPVSVEEFKQISDKQIMHEFKVLQCADLTNQNLICSIPTTMNRYSNILTYEHNRIKIPEIEDFYVNMSGMKSVVDGQQFALFSQAPVPNFQNFWQAIYHKNVSMIIMVCMFIDPKRGNQASKYWPAVDQEAKFKNLVVKTVTEKKLDKQLKESIISVKGADGEKFVKHFHWTGWSDMRAPVGDTLKILENMIEIVKTHVDNKKPMVIHCSAGVGRTGTLAAIVEGERMAREKKSLSVFQIIENFRKHRLGCIQTLEQYMFIYKYLMHRL